MQGSLGIFRRSGIMKVTEKDEDMYRRTVGDYVRLCLISNGL
jgi:hypothetical protein